MPLILDHVSQIYNADTETPVRALDDVSLVLPEGQFIGIIGHTGSGKSTLVQHLNGLMMPTSGNVYYNGRDISDKDFNKKELRKHVGLVFQYPEHQLFETDVFADVCFGPKNMGLSKKEAELATFDALRKVDFPTELYYASVFELSGGQKRRAAIAGVLAMKPDFLVLDEPTAGLDPVGRYEILDMVSALHKESGMTIILVSHSMEDVARYVERVIVMDGGKVAYDDTPREVFSHEKELEDMGLGIPESARITRMLKSRGLDADPDVLTVSEAADSIYAAVTGRNK
ncbi:MAG: energy-coupling factor transporter ATPase [Lachnospiraceae bacterium]|nr:energy-coupling factor transporter ATPase [Lachnospiraceae bacterium]